jgi:O-antigen/teichoic acid export membrane protein
MLNRLLARLRADQNLMRMLKHSGILYAAGGISSLLISLQQITTAIAIGPEAYGRFATIVGISALAMLIADVRTWEVAGKLYARPVLDSDYDELARLTTWLTLVDLLTSAAAALIILLLAAPIATWLLDAPQAAGAVALFTFSLPFRMIANGAVRTLMRMYDRFNWLSVKSLVYALSRLLLITGAALLGADLTGIVLAAVLAEVIGGLTIIVMGVWVYRQHMPGARLIDLRRPRQWNDGKRLIRGLWLSATLWGLEVEMYVPLLALLTSPAQVGLFRSGLDIAETIEKLLVPFMLVLFPQVTRSYEQDTRPRFLRIIWQSMGLMAALTLPVLVGILLAGPFIIPRLLGPGYEGAHTVASLIAVGFTAYGLLMWTRPAMVALNRIRDLNLIGLVSISVSATLLVIFAPVYGAIAAAAVRGGAMVGQYSVSAWLFRREMARHQLPAERPTATAGTAPTTPHPHQSTATTPVDSPAP